VQITGYNCFAALVVDRLSEVAMKNSCVT